MKRNISIETVVEWVTEDDALRKAVRAAIGHLDGLKGGGQEKINSAQRQEIRTKIKNGSLIKDVAEEYGVNRVTIWRVCNNK